MGVLRGWTYCTLWYSSILAGYAGLFCPLLPILFVSNRLYRFCTDALFTFWQFYPTVLLRVLCDCEVQVSGDAISSEETSLVVMNHRTRTDWNFLWPTMYECVKGRNWWRFPTKFVLKDVIRHIPGPGWVMQLACFLFIKRRWHQDRLTLQNVVAYFDALSYRYSLLIFPEGTDLTPSTRSRSDLYAEQRGLPKYLHVLHPRTAGFAHLAAQMLQRDGLDAVYDLTLSYPDLVPQDERELLKGRFPRRVRVHLVRYPKSVLPRTEQGLCDFLERRWCDKERALAEHHATGQFLHGPILRGGRGFELGAALCFWTLLPGAVLYLLWTNRWFRLLVTCHTLLLLLVNGWWEGFQNFEMGVFKVRRRVLG